MIKRHCVLFAVLILIFLIFSTEALSRDLLREVPVCTDALNQYEASIAIHPPNDSLLIAAWNAEDSIEEKPGLNL